MNRTGPTRDADRTLEAIARRWLGVLTLATRGSDDLDFHDVSASALRKALRQAYAAGYEQAITDREPPASSPTGVCPRCGETDHDRLVWDAEGESINCQRCGANYTVHRIG